MSGRRKPSSNLHKKYSVILEKLIQSKKKSKLLTKHHCWPAKIWPWRTDRSRPPQTQNPSSTSQRPVLVLSGLTSQDCHVVACVRRELLGHPCSFSLHTCRISSCLKGACPSGRLRHHRVWWATAWALNQAVGPWFCCLLAVWLWAIPEALWASVSPSVKSYGYLRPNSYSCSWHIMSNHFSSHSNFFCNSHAISHKKQFLTVSALIDFSPSSSLTVPNSKLDLDSILL